MIPRACLLAVLLVPSLASAQAATGAAAQSSGVPSGVYEDPNSDKAFFEPTALTQPGGTGTFNDWELLMLSGTYAPTDYVQISLGGLAPITTDFPIALAGSLKVRLPAGDRLHFALMGAVAYMHNSNTSDVNFNYVGGLGEAMATYCLDQACASTLNGFFGVGFSISESNPALPLLFGGSLVGRISQHVKLLVEVESGGAASLSDNLDSQILHGVVATYGVRFYSSSIAVDLGFTRPIAENVDMGSLFMGIPLLTFSARFGG